jgi:antitoxin component of MazEF toxin-antitoxin module
MKCKIKKWGNSFGVIIPMKVMQEKKLKVGQTIDVHIEKEITTKSLFGILPRKVSGQEFKDIAKEGWGK